MLSLGGSAIYVAVAVLCAMAWRAAHQNFQSQRHTYTWLISSVFFVLLAISRLSMLEARAKQELQALFEFSFAYAERQLVQEPLAAIALIAIGIGILVLFRRRRGEIVGRRARAVFVAQLGMVGMIGLIALRIISYHPIDSLLYRGLHLNWAIDVGLSVAVGWAAWRYTAVLNSGQTR